MWFSNADDILVQGYISKQMHSHYTREQDIMTSGSYQYLPHLYGRLLKTADRLLPFTKEFFKSYQPN